MGRCSTVKMVCVSVAGRLQYLGLMMQLTR